ncbi:MAG TPA: hypothetical protein VF039_02110 [Longimicrobiales bacterium]
MDVRDEAKPQAVDPQHGLAPEMRVRDEDLEPHAGLRYIARLFKVLAVLLVLLLIAEAVIGLMRGGQTALPTLLIEATRLIVFAAFLWAAGDLALMFIESNHDLRATRILVGRLNGRLQRVMEHQGIQEATPPGQRQRGGTGQAAGTTPGAAGTGAGTTPGASGPGSGTGAGAQSGERR